MSIAVPLRQMFEQMGGAQRRPTRVEVVLIAAFADGQISRVWETTWPSCNTLPAFET
jgi:hypothetical protein